MLRLVYASINIDDGGRLLKGCGFRGGGCQDQSQKVGSESKVKQENRFPLKLRGGC